MKNVCFLLFSVQLQLELELSSLNISQKHIEVPKCGPWWLICYISSFLKSDNHFFVKNWLKYKQWIIQMSRTSLNLFMNLDSQTQWFREEYQKKKLDIFMFWCKKFFLASLDLPETCGPPLGYFYGSFVSFLKFPFYCKCKQKSMNNTVFPFSHRKSHMAKTLVKVNK